MILFLLLQAALAALRSPRCRICRAGRRALGGEAQDRGVRHDVDLGFHAVA